MTTIRTLRSLRKEFAPTQGELADLLAISQTAISRLESGAEAGTLESALGLQIIFGTSPRTLFPRLHESVEEAVMARAAKLDRQMRGKADPGSRKKQRLLDGMSRRARPAAARA